MLLLENKYLQLSMDLHSEIAYMEWNKHTAFMSNEDFQNILCMCMEVLKELQPKALLGNDQHFSKPIPPELQEWTVAQLNPHLVKSGIKKMAFTASRDFIGDLSIQQSVEEIQKNMPRKQLSVRYFENIEDAKRWVSV
ncbi:MAG TPA: hypothetical protein DCS93_30895 [Microscillaceae bacterium]|nr:hypothetical protein [Microscillaceae bacterium]